jgi:hypothetical protein
MKKIFFSSIALLVGCIMFCGCSKSSGNLTINPYLTASIGTYNFTSATVVPSTLDTQSHDSTIAFIITGNTIDQSTPHDKIMLSVNKYKMQTGVFSIVQGQASAWYIHSGVTDAAAGGIVAITHITSNSVIGYFSFNTYSGISVLNGAFSVGLP